MKISLGAMILFAATSLAALAQAADAPAPGVGMGPGPGGGMGPGPGGGMGRNMPTYADFDLNGDGKLPEAEFNEARSKRIAERAQQGYPMRGLANMPSFADLDSNGDGSISPEEFTAHQAQRRGRMMQGQGR